jgi:hypothetical protein
MTPQEVLLALRCHQSAIETGRCPKEQCPAFERPARFKCAGTVAKAAADLIEEQAAAVKRLTDKEEKSCGISDVYEVTTCPLCGQLMFNGECENPDCRYHWHPMEDDE